MQPQISTSRGCEIYLRGGKGVNGKGKGEGRNCDKVGCVEIMGTFSDKGL